MLAQLAGARCTRRSFRPQLESLEDRLSPSGMEYLSLNIVYQPNRQVNLSGQLMSQSGPVTNQTIQFGNSVSGTTTTDSQGKYNVTLKATSLGQVTAVSTDGLSNTATGMLTGGTPQINNFSAISQGGGVWLFTGQVTGAPAQGEVINFSGLNSLNGRSCNVNSDGTFNYYCLVPAGQGGVAMAEAVDWWGDTSQEVTTTVVA